jgi:hypothetical protein
MLRPSSIAGVAGARRAFPHECATERISYAAEEGQRHGRISGSGQMTRRLKAFTTCQNNACVALDASTFDYHEEM